MSKNVVEVTDATFEQEILKSELPVIVDFWAAWCPPCLLAAPVVEALAKEYEGKVKFVKLNVDENMLTSQNFMVMSIPSFIGFKSGQETARFVGFMPEPNFKNKIEEFLK